MTKLFLPEWIYARGEFRSKWGLLVGKDGKIAAVGPADSLGSAEAAYRLPGKAILPGFVNAHSHAFQRLIRGSSESRMSSGSDFWSWRNTMYRAANALSAEDVYDAARMVFLEMALAGISTVGEFHYLHRDLEGNLYADPNLLAKQVIAAARSVGLRIVLLRCAYLRSGFEKAIDSGQRRFFETKEMFLDHAKELQLFVQSQPDTVQFGIAPHSIRAVPLAALKEITAWAGELRLPIHMHVSEQRTENQDCVREYGTTPVELLRRESILSDDFTAVHAIHLTPIEIDLMGEAGASVCSCPTTERNLGDGIVAADKFYARGVNICFGTDSQAQLAPLEDARELEYHLRLKQEERSILDQIGGESLASRLFHSCTAAGASVLCAGSGELTAGSWCDFVTIDLNHLGIAGWTPATLLSNIIFAVDGSAICDLAVGGEWVYENKLHPLSDEILSRYQELTRRVWNRSFISSEGGYV